jgi:hypothetical protein
VSGVQAGRSSLYKVLAALDKLPARLASLLQTGGLPGDKQGTLQEATFHTHPTQPLDLHAAEGACRGSGWGPLPPGELSNWCGLFLKRGCTPAHYRAVSDADHRSLTPPIIYGGDSHSAMSGMTPSMLLLGFSKLSGVPRRAVVNMRMSPIPTDCYPH